MVFSRKSLTDWHLTACSNGELVFGGINGLTIFHPKNIKIQEEIYKPIILGVSVFNEEENKSQFTGLVDQSTLSLEHDQNDLEFQFFYSQLSNSKTL